MANIWNKYANTAARKHGKPGRDVRPKSVTIDMHAHVAVPAAAEFVKPHLECSTIPLAHFAIARDQGAERQSRKPTSARCMTRLRRAASPTWTDGRRHAAHHAAAAAVLLHGADRNRGAGGAHDQRRHRRISSRKHKDRFIALRHRADAGRPRGGARSSSAA